MVAWWWHDKISKDPKTYCMQVHLFGATWSPSCTAYALKRTASDNAEMYDEEVISTVHRNFYVDDCLKSVGSEEAAVKLATESQSLMKRGDFRLTKWLSNSRKVLDAIPETERAPSVVKLQLGDSLPKDRALGVLWNVNDDTINFKVKLEDRPVTRRGMLSIVSSIYDPLGLVSPVTLRAKAILQSLCREKIGWDDVAPQISGNEWRRWLSSQQHLENVAVKRCLRNNNTGKLKDVQLHVFNDGSELGYGACAYLRLVDENDSVSCALVLGKARLAPIKQISIPRLELSGAVTACRLSSMISSELDLRINRTVYWTD
ncbi:uncharacterized protein LOC127866840 [Dreissena polymorpha]|uniref:uncharacterized protein LOC127866840 n=1 Tax=Dreissena polymorpha TaxID=45954 RepID=UPI002263BD85|nr:uncharacterized protein LOC127866840 [Dreissena polymorpha]